MGVHQELFYVVHLRELLLNHRFVEIPLALETLVVVQCRLLVIRSQHWLRRQVAFELVIDVRQSVFDKELGLGVKVVVRITRKSEQHHQIQKGGKLSLLWIFENSSENRAEGAHVEIFRVANVGARLDERSDDRLHFILRL